MRLLLVEDDLLLGDGIHAGLSQNGCAVDWAKNGKAAELALNTTVYNAMILDINLPQCDGLTILKKLRARADELPVLILTASDTVADRVHGLDSGADDYMTKPFDLSELDARLRALQRRAKGRAGPLLQHGDIVMDPASHTVCHQADTVALSRREFAVLHMLLDNAGKVLSRAYLEESLYAWSDEVESNAVEVHIHHLRKKFGHNLIRTLRGVGYVIDKPS